MLQPPRQLWAWLRRSVARSFRLIGPRIGFHPYGALQAHSESVRHLTNTVPTARTLYVPLDRPEYQQSVRRKT